jgi:hypothetical protein
MTHSGTVAAPPAFVGYTRDGTPDLRLAANSPAIGRGLALTAAGAAGTASAHADAAAAAPAPPCGVEVARITRVDIGACQR